MQEAREAAVAAEDEVSVPAGDEELRQAELQKVNEDLQRFEAQRRWADYIRTTVRKAEIVENPEAKRELYAQAGQMYIEKSSNQAEAIKCFEAVIAIEPHDRDALAQLRQLYERRRDWERLIEVMKTEVELLDPDQQAASYVEMAQLATTRMRKPEIAAELWDMVLELEPGHAEALASLAKLHERSRAWEPLAKVLEQLSEHTASESELAPMLEKLGMIYAEKLNQPERAVDAFRRVLLIKPDDRRAQEQLKRQYVAKGAWDDLEDFYGDAGRWDELIRVLEREAEQPSREPSEKVDLLFRSAKLWETKKEKVDRAARAYEKILAADADNERAAAALAPIYEQAGDARKLYPVYQALLRHETVPERKAELLSKLGTLAEERLRNPSDALNYYLEALPLLPHDEALQEALERVGKSQNAWERVVETYESTIESLSGSDRHALRLRLAAILSSIDRTDDAIAQYEALYEEHRSMPGVFESLRELYEKSEQHEKLLQLYEDRLTEENDPERAKALAYQRALLLKDALQQPEKAAAAYQDIVAEHGYNELQAFAQLDALYTELERHQELADVLRRRVELAVDPSTVIELKFRLAKLHEQKLAHKAAAIELYREVLTLQPEHGEACGALEALLDDPQYAVEAAEVLEPIYEVQGEWEQLVKAYEAKAKAVERPEERVELLRRVGEVQSTRLNDFDKAFTAYAEAFQAMPQLPETLQTLEMLAAQHEKFPELVELVSEVAAEADKPLARDLWIKAATIHDTDLGSLEASVAAYSKVLAADPDDQEILVALETLYRRLERWNELLNVLRRRAEISVNPAEQEELLLQCARIYVELVGEIAQAIRVYREVLELNPTSELALAALDQLLEQQERWGDLADNVSRRLSLATTAEARVPLLLRLASIRETRMNAVDSAIEIYREVLEQSPRNPQALEALERLLDLEDYQDVISEVLEPIYRESGDVQKLIGIHEVQAARAGAVGTRIQLLHQIAELYEVALDDPNQAFQTYARALGEDPADTQTQDQLERLARTSGDWNALVNVYETQVEELEDAQLKASLHMKAAQACEQFLDDTERAIRHYKKVLELDGHHLDAADALERLYQMEEQYEELAANHLLKAEILTDPHERQESLFRGAFIYEDVLDRPQRAIEVYRKILEHEPEEVRALDKLIAQYLRVEEWDHLLEVYTTKADVIVDLDEKKRIYAEVGSVYEAHKGDVPKAIDTYQRILEIDPGDLPALQALDRLYQATENWSELLSVLDRQTELVQEPEVSVELRYRMARLWEKQLSDPERAVEGYGAILATYAEHAPTMAALEEMVDEGREPLAAAAVLEPVFRGSGDWQKLTQLRRVEVAHEQDAFRKIELWHEIAELQETHIDNPHQAFDAYAEALELDPLGEKTLLSFERLAEYLNRWDELAARYDKMIAVLKEKGREPEAAELAMRLAQLFEVQIGDMEQSIRRYELVIEMEPENAPALDALERLYESTEDWRQLAEVIRKQLPIAPTPSDVLELQFRLGQLYQNQLDETGKAIQSYRDILAAEPDHQQALTSLELLFAEGVQPVEVGEILEPIYRMRENWQKLLDVYVVQLEHTQDRDERIRMMLRMSELAETRAERPDLAMQYLLQALREEPADEQVISELHRVAELTGSWIPVAGTYVDVLGHQELERETRLYLARKVARVYEEQLDDKERAEQSYRYVLGIEGHDEEALEALDRIYEASGSFDSLSKVLRRRIQAAGDNEISLLIELHYRLGQALDVDPERLLEAEEVYQRVVRELEPDHLDSIRALQSIYARLERWEDLEGALKQEINVVSGDQARSDVYASLAHLATDRLGNDEAATEHWRHVLELRGEDPEALNALGNLYARSENWRDLVDVLEREVSTVAEPTVKIAILSDLGRVWYDKLHRERNALESWESVLDIDPQHLDALFQIADIHERAGSHTELANTLHRIVDVGGDTLEAVALQEVYLRLGKLYWKQMEQPMDAADAYRKVLEIHSFEPEALDALESIYRDEELWQDCIAIVERRVEATTDPAQKVDYLLAIGNMWEEKVGQPDDGVPAFERVLELDPVNAAAFQGLESAHREGMRWDSLVDTYLLWAEQTADVRARVAIIRKIASVYENELADRDKAFEALQLAWAEDYTDRETANDLERLAGLTQKWNELLSSANEALQQLEETELKIGICLSCARWYGVELGHPEYAIPYYEQILALDPANVDAMRQMLTLYRNTEQWDLLAQVQGRLVEMLRDPVEKAEVYVEMGQLCERELGHPERAPGYYSHALETDPKNLAAIEALEDVHRQRQDWDELQDILDKKVEASPTEEEAVRAQLQVGELLEFQLSELDRAAEAYRGVRERDPMSLKALQGLERVYTQLENWKGLLEVTEAQYELVTTEGERVSTLMRLASMYEEQFRKPDKSAEKLEQVLEIDPNEVAALRGLVRLYRQLQQWERVVSSYERYVDATPERLEKVELLKQLARVFSDELRDVNRAIDSYLHVLDLEATDAEALSALAELYEKRGDYSEALETNERLARSIQAPDDVVQMRFRMGRLLDEHLGDQHGALEQFRHALDVKADHQPSLKATRKIQVANGDWNAAARTLEQLTAVQANARERAHSLVELGQIYQERLDEHHKAVMCFERALGDDADNEEAALPLVDEYIAHERWDEALPLLQTLTARASKRDTDQQHRLNFQLGQCAAKVGDDKLANRAYTRAYQIDASHVPSLIGLASSYLSLKEWDKAFKFYQMLLVHHRSALGKDETTDIFYRLGEIKSEQGEQRKALNMFDKALEEDPYHRPTLEAVVNIYEQLGDFEQVIHFKSQVAQGSNDEERFEVLIEVGDLWSSRLNNPQKAIQSYSEASDLRPDDHRVLHKLLGLYQDTRQWQRAIDIIDRVRELDGRAPAKSKYSYTIGVIFRDELKNAEEAVERFGQALDEDPSQLKAFEAINKILTRKKDWKQLERQFRKMLHRVTGQGNTDLEFNLWHNLGVIYRDRLKQFEAAAEAFKMASRLRPESTTEHTILAELYLRLPDRTSDAVEEHHWLLRNDANNVSSYQALYKLYFESRQYDKAWCVASAMSFLKLSDREQKQFFEQYRSRGMVHPRDRLNNEQWIKQLFHPSEDLYVGKLFEAVTPGVLALKQKSDRQCGLNKKYQVDPLASTAAFAKAFSFVAQLLSLPLPRLFLRPDVSGGLAHAVVQPPASVCGSSLLMGVNPQDLTFVIAKHLSYYRGEHYLRKVLPTAAELKLVLLAALKIAGVGPSDPNVENTARAIAGKLQPVQLEAVKNIAKRFVQAEAKADIKQWMRASELTACRVGFLVANDLEIAARMISADSGEGTVDVSAKEKVREVILFGVSEDYFALRERLGIQIQLS